MNDGIKKFRDLLLTDAEFRQKLKSASEAYDGEEREEAYFNNVLVPLGQEYGISATFEEFQAYFNNMEDEEMEPEELSQIAGGKVVGIGKQFDCTVLGVGIGGGGGDGNGGACFIVGGGWGGYECSGSGREA